MTLTQQPPRIAVIGAIPELSIQRLRAVATTVEISAADLRSGAATDKLASVEGMLITGQAPIDRRVLEQAPKLQVVSLRAVGYDRVDVDACRSAGVAVCTTAGVLDGAVADLTVLLTLAAARRRPWTTYKPGVAPIVELGSDLRGGTFGIVGLGRIGRTVARTVSAGFAMEVVHFSRSRRDDHGVRFVDLAELLRISDVVSLHVPFVAGAPPVIGAAELEAMKPTALLINTSRGGLIDEGALTDALRAGTIAGAALDVTEREPLPSDDLLWNAPNLILTPHVASATVETRAAMAEMAVDNLLAVLGGVEPRHRVA